jgi:hypothetical protein
MLAEHGPRHPAPGTTTPVNSPRFNKARRPFGEPVAFEKGSPRFLQPPFTNNVNLLLPLNVVLRDQAEEARIHGAGRLVFHSVGDTGGVKGEEAQESIAHAMEAQIQTAGVADRPAFFFHLGDVVYFNGLRHLYGAQFYDPYKYYPAPIFAIPGNHDGDTATRKGDEPDTEPTLAGFMDNFCAPQAEKVDAYRELMTQPYVYWALDAPFVRVIGLYSNVDGSVDGRGRNEQQAWLEQQLQAAPVDKALLIAVHHPPYSLDASHGGSPDILDAIERAVASTKRWPDAVLSGHVHNYQRFTREVDSRQIPFVVAGNGGYADSPQAIHKLQLDAQGHRIPAGKRFKTTRAGVFLETYEETNPGFMRLTVDSKHLTVEYFVVPFDDAPPAEPVDRVTVDLKAHKLVRQ